MNIILFIILNYYNYCYLKTILVNYNKNKYLKYHKIGCCIMFLLKNV